ncbi:nucleotide-binding alpha-beta plait domain-containing protein [Tanacetum coccineum]
MGSQRSKEDEVQKISTSVFVTNFPDQFNAKDLWNTCKQYGNVVDAYIPNRRSKAGSQPLSMEMENNPALVLDNLCLNQQDYSNFLMGKSEGFCIFIKLEGKLFWVRAKEIPGWVPDFVEDNDEKTDTDDETNEGESNGEDVGLKISHL